MLIRSFRGGITDGNFVLHHPTHRHCADGWSSGPQVIALVGAVAVEVSGDPFAMMDVWKSTARKLGDGLYEVSWEWEKEKKLGGE